MELTNRTAIITGATSGIGLALTHQLAAAGCRVVAVARSSEMLAELESSTDGIITIRCDLTDKQAVMALGQQLRALTPTASILINNAAVQFTPSFTDPSFSFDGIALEVTTNFTAVAWLTALILPTLLQRPDGAALVNVSSALALYPKTSSAVYCATKAALHSLSQSLRYQLEGTPVTVTEIILPLVDTAMTQGRGGEKLTTDRAAREILTAIRHRREEHYVGRAGLLPILARLSPALPRRILKRA